MEILVMEREMPKAKILISSLESKVFEVCYPFMAIIGADDFEGHIDISQHKKAHGKLSIDKTMTIEFGNHILITRLPDTKGTGFVANIGPCAIGFSYHRNTGIYGPEPTQVGPTHDWLLPLQVKELGIGPGMAWRVDPQ